ncbi:MAG TPA: redoxin domain-containing protein [Acidimicrobiia bacterium]|nr:redoxin domain-containing protein [Acidimicrobiia bacterium]
MPLILATLVAVSTLTETDDVGIDGAIPFELTAANGQTVSLDNTLAEGDALLYFSMGVGCDGCFAQIPELEAAMIERELTLLPIMVDPAPMVAAEAARFGIEQPILIDPGARISSAYGMVGIYGHGDRPSHSFALVRQSGDIAWVRHYAEMFVPVGSLLAELDAALGS